jgi:hypothetical protein
MNGGWKIDEQPTGNTVELWFELNSKNAFLRFMVPVLAYMSLRGFVPVIQKMDKKANQLTFENESSRKQVAFTFLLSKDIKKIFPVGLLAC